VTGVIYMKLNKKGIAVLVTSLTIAVSYVSVQANVIGSTLFFGIAFFTIARYFVMLFHFVVSSANSDQDGGFL